jgi:hypothetical protein
MLMRMLRWSLPEDHHTPGGTIKELAVATLGAERLEQLVADLLKG